MCEKAQVDGVLEVKPYACPPRVPRPKVVMCKDEEEALAVINEAANWPWDPSCMALDREGLPTYASRVRIFSDSQSALQSISSWRASVCQEVIAEIIKKL
jgi:hypothetical protein